MNGARLAKLLVTGLLVALCVWVARHTYWGDTKVPMPLKGEAARNPFYAAQRFAETLGAHTEWQRVLSTPGSDAVMVLSAWNWGLSTGRRQRMERWVESGGRLVVDRSLITGSDDFERWSGVSHFHRERRKEPDEQRNTSVPSGAASRCHTLLEEGNATDPDGDVRRRYRICGIDAATSLRSARKEVWALRDESGIQALRVNVGRGSVTVINATPFRYRDLLTGDHATLFALATQLRGGDDIRFLSEDDHASLLTLSWQFGAPVVALVLASIVLALWRGSARFGPLVAATEAARRSIAEQIRGTGQFALRCGGGEALHAAAVRALREAASRRISAYDRLPTEERVATLARATGLATDELAAAIHYSGARRSNELRSAIALLEAARRRILIENTRSTHGNRTEHDYASR